MTEKLLHELAFDEIKAIISQKQYKDLKLVEQKQATGVSFFQGKDRLCKIVKSKRGLTIEINVQLPEELTSLMNVTSITREEAYKKRLGTMKHIYKGSDLKEVKKIMTTAVKIFQHNMKHKKAMEG